MPRTASDTRTAELDGSEGAQRSATYVAPNEEELSNYRRRGALRTAELRRQTKAQKATATPPKAPAPPPEFAALNRERSVLVDGSGSTEEDRYRNLARAVVVYNAQLALGKVRVAGRRDPEGTPEKAWDWLRDKKRSQWWCHAAGVKWAPIVNAVGQQIQDSGKMP
jgi:hypothetical protein